MKSLRTWQIQAWGLPREGAGRRLSHGPGSREPEPLKSQTLTAPTFKKPGEP